MSHILTQLLFFQAIREGNINLVECFLSSGNDFYTSDIAIAEAIKHKQKNILKLLKKYNREKNE